MQNFKMIDVGEKQITRRRATSTGKIRVHPEAMQMIRSGVSPKGNILAIAEVAGIMSAKNTPHMLPLCHSLPLDSVRVWFDILEAEVQAFCEVVCQGKTGVEMEAMVGLSTTLLTIYDLAKVVDPEIEISEMYLIQKEGGKSGDWKSKIAERKGVKTETPPKLKHTGLAGYKFSVLTLSDRASKGVYPDQAGTLLTQYGLSQGALEHSYEVIPDDAELLKRRVLDLSKQNTDIILLTGGTGIGSRDISVETIRAVSSKELPGFGEAQRSYGANFTAAAWLSRSSAFVVGESLVVLFPGSPKAVTQGLEAIGHLLGHAVRMIRGGSHD
jgi:cyclic pyranopterin monophosphate synthase